MRAKAMQHENETVATSDRDGTAGDDRLVNEQPPTSPCCDE